MVGDVIVTGGFGYRRGKGWDEVRRREAGSNEVYLEAYGYMHSSHYNILIVEKETNSKNFTLSIGVNVIDLGHLEKKSIEDIIILMKNA